MSQHDRVLCPICQRFGQLSTVQDIGTMTTLMGFMPGYYDEQGEYRRNHDPNTRTTEYQCSRGDRFGIDRRDGAVDVIVETFAASRLGSAE